jgi:3-hydroxymyristoyl/3-hydroxydecanoyl-(acyl carrier protein) dehydratase
MIREILEETLVPHDHPCLEGHFPGNSVVPGTVVLEKVIKALAKKLPTAKVSEVVSAKFLSPLKPGETFSLRISQQAGAVQFACSRDGQLIASGRLTVAADGQS